jgi:hypothetical protein
VSGPVAIDVPGSAPWLLAQARELLAHAGDATAGRWPRAVALLGRQALEVAVDERCAELDPGLGACTSARAQLLCLREAVDADLARAAAHAWSALSRACHVHAYELPPTAEELAAWLDTVERLLVPRGSADQEGSAA